MIQNGRDYFDRGYHPPDNFFPSNKNPCSHHLDTNKGKESIVSGKLLQVQEKADKEEID